MYISRVQLDLYKKKTAEALYSNRSLLHSAFESSVEGGRPHIIWRVEPDMSILAISREIPYLGDIQQMYGKEKTKPVTKPYDALLDAIKSGMVLKFRVTVNPVVIDRRAQDPGKGKSRRDVPLNLKPTQNYSFCAEDWTRKKLEKKGAKVMELHDTRSERVYFKKDGNRIPLFLVTYEGTLAVEDEKLFRTALTDGIGGKKTYGSSMLTVARSE